MVFVFYVKLGKPHLDMEYTTRADLAVLREIRLEVGDFSQLNKVQRSIKGNVPISNVVEGYLNAKYDLTYWKPGKVKGETEKTSEQRTQLKDKYDLLSINEKENFMVRLAAEYAVKGIPKAREEMTTGNGGFWNKK